MSSLSTTETIDRERAVIQLLSDCHYHCVFCGQHGAPAISLDTDAVRTRLSKARHTSDEVTFVGGEPTLFETLPDVITMARDMGFHRVGIQTNGHRLARTDYATLLVQAGLTDVHMSIHGATSIVHDYHTGVPGSFARALSAIGVLRAHGVTVVATTVLTRSNFRVLADIPRLLSTRGVAGWLVAVPHVAGRAAIAFDRVIPRLALATPFALHALATARTLGLPAWIRGVPHCLLGPYGAHALPEPPRAYGTMCTDCPARKHCSGVDAMYLQRFGGDELSPRPSFEPLRDCPELTRMFVGPGQLFRPSRSMDVVSSPSARARVSLPVLGKTLPARDEVPASAPRRTGEALREILPDLFRKTEQRS